MTLRVGFDVDGVLADFRTAFEKTARRVLHHATNAPEDPECVRLSAVELDKVWQAIGRSHNWWASLGAFEPQQIPRLYELARTLRWEVTFLTKRPPSAGDTVQFQTQWWLEQHGFAMPSVITVPGSRGELANALRLDLVVDDQFVNCAEIVGASTARAVLVQRRREPAARDHALARGVGVVATLEEAIGVIERLHDVLPKRRGRLLRLTDWFFGGERRTDAPLAPTTPRPPLSER
jgi:hypothetical protein